MNRQTTTHVPFNIVNMLSVKSKARKNNSALYLENISGVVFGVAPVHEYLGNPA